MRGLLVLTILFLSTYLLANAKDSEVASTWINKAMSYLNEEKPDSARHFLEQALTHYQQTDDLKNWVRVFRQAGANAQARGQSQEAVAFYTEAIKRRWRKPQDSLEFSNFAWVLANRGFTYSSGQGNYQKGIEDYEYCRRIFVDSLQQEDYAIARYVYSQLGNMYTRIGDYEKALFYLNKVKDIAIAADDPDLAAEAYGDMGIAYESGSKPEVAKQAFLDGLALKGVGSMAKSFLHNNLAVQYCELKEFEEALASNQEAERIIKVMLKKEGAKGQRRLQLRQNANLNNFGRIYRGLGQYERAATYYKSLIQEASEQYATTKRREVGKLYIAYGRLYEAWEKPDSALHYYQKALHCVLPNFEAPSPLVNPNAKNFYAENTILEALQAKANLFALQGQQKDESLLKKALECHELTFVVEEQLRQHYQYESSKLTLIRERRLRTEQAIELAYQLWTLTGAEDYLHKAFRYAEQSKAIVLLESLKKLGAQNTIGIPDSLLELERSIRKEESDIRVASIEERLKGDLVDQAQLQGYWEQLFRLEQQQQELSKIFSQKYPKYYRQKYQLMSVTVAQLQQRLATNQQTMVEYFVGEQSIFIFCIADQQIQLIRQAKPATFGQSLQEYLNLLSQKWQAQQSVEQFKQQSHTLYQFLIEALDIQTQRLIIIPDGRLSYLPFETLLTHADVGTDVANLPYFLQQQTISYAFSATVLMEQPRSKKQHLKKFLGIAPIDFNYDNLASLTYSQQEISDINKVLKGHALLGPLAKKETFLKEAKGYKVINLSTHATAGEAPWIAFADQKLYLPELYALEIGADLVVLSACETGLGAYQEGEGVMSLARGFAYSGVPGVVMSLWSINESSSHQLMRLFYEQLDRGLSKEAALNQAQRTYLQGAEGIQASPYYWAGLVAIGDMEPVFGASFGWPIVVVVVMLGLLLLLLRLRGASADKG